MKLLALLDDTLTRTVAGMAALTCSTALAAYYFFGMENGVQSAAAPWCDFYSQLISGRLKLDEPELRGVLQKGDAEPMTLLALRTALGRWRLRSTAPEAFSNVMRDYQHGVWSTASLQHWEQTFEWLDRGWLDARRTQARDQQSLPTPAIFPEGADGLLIRLPGTTLACQLGSVLRVRAELPDSSMVDDTPKLYWQTQQANAISQYRRRLGSVDVSTTVTAGGHREAVIQFDFSWEPFWISPGVQPTALHLRCPRAASWTNVQIEFADSPLLRP